MNSETQKQSLSILFTGDIYPGEISLSEELLKKMSQADYRIGNLECVMGEFDFSQAASGKTVLPCVSPSCVNFLKNSGFDCVTLANNHMFDYGVEGFKSNRDILTSAGIAYSGAGENFEQACKPHIFEKNGVKVAIVSCAWNGTEAAYATETSPGCAPLDENWLRLTVHELKNSVVDHVILYVHWGYCGYSCPLPEHKNLAEQLLEEGYSAIIGHHNHQLQGLMSVDGRVIAFGLGDFVFAPYVCGSGKPVERPNINCQSAILKLILDKNRITGREIEFTLQRQGLVDLDNNPSRRKAFNTLGSKLQIRPYTALWKKQVRKRLIRRILYWMNPLNWRNINPRTFKALVIMIKNLVIKDSGDANV